jgi:ADP-heptose:LPS heptosyltransferase
MRQTLLRGLKILVRAFRPRRRNVAGPRTVLVLQYQMPLGCCVHGIPLFAALAQTSPPPTVVVATRATGKAALAHDPHVAALIETEDPMLSLHSMWSVRRRIRAEIRRLGVQPDLILQDASNRRGRFALLALLVGLAPTSGFAEIPELYDIPLAYDPQRSLIDNNLRLAAEAGGSAAHIEPVVYFTRAELERARSLLAEVNPDSRPVTAFVVQGSGGQRTAWHEDRFAEVIRFVDGLGHRVVYLGTIAEAAEIESTRRAAGERGQSLAGKTTIPELAALLCLCDLLITVDTGTMHVGRASDVPMVVLGPSWQRPLEWLPLDRPQARVLRGPDRDNVPPGYRLDEIQVEDVIAAARDLLATFPPTTEAREARAAARLSTTRETER